MPRLPPEGGVVAPCVQAMKCNFFCSSLGDDAGSVVVSVVAAGAFAVAAVCIDASMHAVI